MLVEGWFVEEVGGYGASVGNLSTSQATSKKQFKIPTMPAVKTLGGTPYGRSPRAQNGRQEQGEIPTSAHSHSRSKSSGSESGMVTLSTLSTLCSGNDIGGSRSSSAMTTPRQLPVHANATEHYLCTGSDSLVFSGSWISCNSYYSSVCSRYALLYVFSPPLRVLPTFDTSGLHP
ncbi:hypothetical protein BDQ12DRAFT_406131 [Crucibulum laeve]|uniref:Uncharacterized protein n=1 Tax=Crucibulum laeve TaxID=68775 RepID=A0A5C3LLU3_9AGAR|nr:hypothetical protein BDQ12DRAFT_406131 [Crucibulum laeve]